MKGYLKALLHFFNKAFSNRQGKYLFVDFDSEAFNTLESRRLIARLKDKFPDLQIILIGAYENYFLLSGRIKYDINGFYVEVGSYRVDIPLSFLELTRTVSVLYGFYISGTVGRPFTSLNLAQAIYDYIQDNDISNAVILLNDDVREGRKYFREVLSNVSFYSEFTEGDLNGVIKQLNK